MKTPLDSPPSPLRRQATDTFLRARKLPSGPLRNDLRQLAFELLRLHKLGIKANVRMGEKDAVEAVYRSPSNCS
jgi:hypothetical protein